MPHDFPKVLLLGNTQPSEMQPVAEFVRQHSNHASLKQAKSLSAALELVNGQHWFPDLVVVCQNRPDEFSRTNVERLLSLLPLTRWVCCFGAWCESDGRNRDIWPLSVRVPARCAHARIRRELGVLLDQQPSLPLTASRDEIFAYDRPGHLPQNGSQLPVAVFSPDFELRAWLTDLLIAAGYQSGSTDHPESPAAIVWDVDPLCEPTLAKIRDFRSHNPGIAIVALAAFAHPEDVQALKTCGADAVVAKLTTQTDLLDALQNAVTTRRQTATLQFQQS